MKASSAMGRDAGIMQTELFKVERKEDHSTEEVWVTCPGFPKYAVSSLGRFKQQRSGRMMALNKDINGYPVAQLTAHKKQKAVLAHRLVCEAFHGPQPEGKAMVNHIDGSRSNNAASNLEWVSRSANARHSWASSRRRAESVLVERYVTCHNSV